MRTVIVANMITEIGGGEPIDQGPQAVCENMAALERWVSASWPHARRVTEDAWEIFTPEGESLETFIVFREMEVHE